MTDLHNIEEVLTLLEGKLVHTQSGSYIKVDDLRDLVGEQVKAKTEESQKPTPRTFTQAKQMAKLDPELAAAFAPPVAVEGVKA